MRTKSLREKQGGEGREKEIEQCNLHSTFVKKPLEEQESESRYMRTIMKIAIRIKLETYTIYTISLHSDMHTELNSLHRSSNRTIAIHAVN